MRLLNLVTFFTVLGVSTALQLNDAFLPFQLIMENEVEDLAPAMGALTLNLSTTSLN